MSHIKVQILYKCTINGRSIVHFLSPTQIVAKAIIAMYRSDKCNCVPTWQCRQPVLFMFFIKSKGLIRRNYKNKNKIDEMMFLFVDIVLCMEKSILLLLASPGNLLLLSNQHILLIALINIIWNMHWNIRPKSELFCDIMQLMK